MINLREIVKVYDLGRVQVQALAGVNLEVARGEFLTIMGPSGSGKSTLLHILGLLDRPTSGSYALEGHEVGGLSDRELARIRNRHFGFVFQSFNLFPEFNAVENVMMPLLYAGMPSGRRKKRALELLERVGLAHRVHHYPNMLSGGEQQRVAIARALANDPDLILADEPTGNLPSRMGLEILAMLFDLNEGGATVIMVTHDDRLGACGRRMVRMEDGRIIADDPVKDRFDPRQTVDARRGA